MIETALGKIQNLVDYRDIIDFQQKAEDTEKKEAVARVLYQIFNCPDQELTFRDAYEKFDHCYALVTYFYFLKDSENYLVVRPKDYAWRLQMLGIKNQCVLKCTWSNYQYFLAAMKEIRQQLDQRFEEDISLLDAQTFLWMLWLIQPR